ncbi:MAG: DNA-3-methyladenine glycosylase, partial [Microbacteriaceae bacterium]
LARGVLRIGAHRDPDELRRELVSYRGIGPWTADYVALRVLSAPDLMMPGDSALRLGLRRLGVDDGLVAFAEPFRPWRSYLALHLWSNAAAPSSP